MEQLPLREPRFLSDRPNSRPSTNAGERVRTPIHAVSRCLTPFNTVKKSPAPFRGQTPVPPNSALRTPNFFSRRIPLSPTQSDLRTHISRAAALCVKLARTRPEHSRTGTVAHGRFRSFTRLRTLFCPCCLPALRVLRHNAPRRSTIRTRKIQLWNPKIQPSPSQSNPVQHAFFTFFAPV
jgi:hypothetical protein